MTGVFLCEQVVKWNGNLLSSRLNAAASWGSSKNSENAVGQELAFINNSPFYEKGDTAQQHNISMKAPNRLPRKKGVKSRWKAAKAPPFSFHDCSHSQSAGESNWPPYHLITFVTMRLTLLSTSFRLNYNAERSKRKAISSSSSSLETWEYKKDKVVWVE